MDEDNDNNNNNNNKDEGGRSRWLVIRYLFKIASNVYSMYINYRVHEELDKRRGPAPFEPPAAPPMGRDDAAEFTVPLDGEDVESDDDAHTCCICLTNAIQTVILECAHSVLCLTCSRRFLEVPEAERKCPKCRAPMTKIKRIFIG